jgi:hypothetical protein
MSDAGTARSGWRSDAARPGGGIFAIVVAAACVMLTLIAVRTFVSGTVSGAFSSDFPWLWRTGQHILDTRSLPAGDIFSWSAEGQPWVLYQWLFEVAIAGIERTVGIGGLVLIFNLLAVGIYVVAPALGAVPRRVALPWTVMAGGAALAIASINLSLRPMIVSCGLLLLQYVLVQGWRRGSCGLRHVALWLIPVYALWANMHTGIVLGLQSLLLMAIGDLVEHRRLCRFEPADPAIEGRPQSVAAYAALIGVAFVASMANPYGWGIYSYLASLSADGRLNAEIAELSSPDFHMPQLTWFLGFVGVLLLLLTQRRRTLAPADLLLLLGFTVATLFAQRFVIWAALYFALVLPRALHHAWGERLASMRGGWSARALVTAAAVLMPVTLALTGKGETALGAVCEPLLPAIDTYAVGHRPGDKLLNDPLVGSCAIGRDPGLRVFIDTRFDMYGGARLDEALRMLRLQSGWREALAQRNIDAILITRGWPLGQALALDPGFRVAHADDAAILFRRTASSAAAGN